MSLRLMQIVLILAPLMLGTSLVAYWRLRRFVYDSPEPIAVFLQHRWNAVLIVFGGLVLLRGAAISHGVGPVPQLFGFFLALEFLYIAYANIRVVMSARGVLFGMRFLAWQRVSSYVWKTDRDLVLTMRRRNYRLRVPAQVRDRVQEIVDLHILK